MGTLPKQVEYALIALSDMHSARPGSLFSVRALCELHEIPFDVLSKAMQRLAHAGVLRSVQGVNGGYQIIRDLEQVSLLDVIEAVAGSVSTVACQDPGRTCSRSGSCSISAPMDLLNEKLQAFYRDISVLEFVQDALPA